jgi:hypothetical protein
VPTYRIMEGLLLNYRPRQKTQTSEEMHSCR